VQQRSRLAPVRQLADDGDGRRYPQTDARAMLDAILVDSRRGAAAQGRTGLTFEALAEEWYRRGKLERDWSPST